MSNQPHIIFIMADQLAASYIGCYGSGVDSTPTLDHLAETGMKFTRCYATSPVCAPNRANILTGRTPAIHGIVSNNYVLTGEEPTYAKLLQDNGYRVGGFGKFHQTPMQRPLPENLSYLGFDESILTEDPKLGPWLDWVVQEYPEHYDIALAMSWSMPYLNEYGSEKKDVRKQWERAYKQHVEPLKKQSDWGFMYASPLPKEIHQTSYITNCAIDFMDRHQAEHTDQPFFCHVSYVDPHDPYDPPEPYASMFNPEDMKPPIPIHDEVRNNPIMNESRGRFQFQELDDKPEVVKQLRAKFHGSLRFIDDQVNRIVQYVKDQQLEKDTLIIFTTDHGDMLGDFGLITKGNMHFDGSIRCPLIVSGSGVPSKVVSDRLTCSLDFFPTFCDLAAIDSRPPLEGKSFFKTLVGTEETELWKAVTVEMQQVRTMITDDYWRFTIFDREDSGEMFHLQEDPQEMNNLFHDSNATDKKLDLYSQMTRSYMKLTQIPQYRNLPVVDDCKYLVNNFDLKPTYTKKND